MTSSEEYLIDVDYYCTYLTETQDVQWTNENYQAMNMVKAIKGDEFRGYISIKIKDVEKKFYSSNSDEFYKICHRPLLKILKDKYCQPITIVPIPSSKTTDENCKHFRTKQMAERISKSMGGAANSDPLLLFKSPMPSSRQGGNRSPYFIESQLQLNGRTNRPIVLLDDVMTLGGHIKAACWKLQSEGMRVVGAVTFARTVKDNALKPLGPHTEQIDVSRTPTLWDF